MQNILKKLEVLFEKANSIEVLNLIVETLEELSDSKYTNIVDWNYINDLYNINIEKISNWCSKIKKIIESNMKKENQKENNSIQSTLNTILESLNDLKVTVYNMDQRLVKVENDVGKTNETVDELKVTVHKMDQRLVKVENDVSKTNETVDELKVTVYNMDQRLVKVENDVSKTNETVDELKVTVHKMDQRLVKLETKFDTGFGNLKKHFGIDFLK